MNTGRIITALATILAIPAMAADAPGYFKVPGTETTLKIYGFVQADGVYDIDGNYGLDNGMYPTEGGWNDQNEVPDNQWNWRAKARFGFTTTTPSSLGDVVVKMEFQAVDNAGSSSENVVKMRHAFGKIGGLTIGKTDSLFADWDASANYMDNDGPLYDFYGNSRVNQISYAFSPAEGWNLAFGLEQNKNKSVDKGFDTNSLVAAAGYSGDWGHVRASLATQKSKTEDDSKSVISWGLGTNVVVGKGNITAQVFEGVGFYGTDTADYIDAYDYQKAFSWNIGYSHAVTDAITVAGGFGETKWKKDDETMDTTVKLDNFFVNCQWQATKQTSFGAEYFYGKLKADGQDFEPKESRINLRAKFQLF